MFSIWLQQPNLHLSLYDVCKDIKKCRKACIKCHVSTCTYTWVQLKNLWRYSVLPQTQPIEYSTHIFLYGVFSSQNQVNSTQTMVGSFEPPFYAWNLRLFEEICLLLLEVRNPEFIDREPRSVECVYKSHFPFSFGTDFGNWYCLYHYCEGLMIYTDEDNNCKDSTSEVMARDQLHRTSKFWVIIDRFMIVVGRAESKLKRSM